MPIYEFFCKDCRHEFKKLTKVDLADSISCPTCGRERVSRLLSVTARSASGGDFAGGACGLPMGGG